MRHLALLLASVFATPLLGTQMLPHVDAVETRESDTVCVVTLTARDNNGNLCPDISETVTAHWSGNAPGTFLEPSSGVVMLVNGSGTLRVRRPVQTESTITRLSFLAAGESLLGCELWLRNADDVKTLWEADPNGGASRELPASRVGSGFDLSVRTERPYNMFTDTAQPLSFDISCTSRTNVSMEVIVKYSVYDWDGVRIASCAYTNTMAAGSSRVFSASFDPIEERGIYFVVAEVIRKASNKRQAFTRTNLVRLPPHAYCSTPDDSVFGMADWWPLPTQEDAQNLLDRLGVRWVRSGDARFQHTGRVANYHNEIADWNNAMWEESQREHWAALQIETCQEKGCRYFEFGNEVNLYVTNGCPVSSGIGLCHFADAYTAWVKTFDKVMKKNGARGSIGLLGCGMAGFDHAFAERMRDAGILPMLDGFCIHPNASEYVPEFPYRAGGRHGAPERSPSSHPADYPTPGTSSGAYWNFLGTVRAARDWLDRHAPGMPLWVTEFYSPSYPNYAHGPSERDGADNVVLQYALLKAEGVKAGMFYMMCDGIGSDRFGLDPDNREYSFGLLRHDLSMKPAALGYCAIAEALDGATFRGWMKMPDEMAHGLMFDTPRGPLAVMWGRWDGLFLSWEDSNGICRHKEPWIDRWATVRSFDFPATPQVVRIDSIGRSRMLETANGIVTVELGASPCLVYGLAVDAVEVYGDDSGRGVSGLALQLLDTRFLSTDGAALEQLDTRPDCGLIFFVN